MLQLIKKWLTPEKEKETYEDLSNMDLSDGSMNAEEDQSKESYSEQLVQSKKVEGTPFTIVKMPELTGGNVFIGIGDQRLTEPMSEKAALRMIENKEWELVMNLIVYLHRKVITRMQDENK